MRQSIGVIAALATLPGFVIYLRGVFSGQTRPHAFSWLVWSVLNTIAFSAQVSEGGGAGSLVSAAVGLGTFSVFATSLWRGERSIVLMDWLSLGGAALAGLAWLATDAPLLSVVLISLVDAFGSFPTFRKSFNRPHEESLPLYVLDACAFLAAVFALDNVKMETALFPLFVFSLDASLVLLIVTRRKALALKSNGLKLGNPV